jgi:hypothetical protein
MPIVMIAGIALATMYPSAAEATQTYRPAVHTGVTRAACGKTKGVTFQALQFVPATVDEGGTATLEETISNCSTRAFTGSVQTSGKDVCLIVDPVRQQVALQRRRLLTLSMTYAVPDCTGTGTITGQLLSHTGQQLAMRSASFQSVVPPPTPTVVASPADVMVDTATTLTGTGFPANATVTIKECSQTTWIVPEDPCATSNVVTVATNPGGGFQTTMTATYCPGTSPSTVATPSLAQRCYVGEPVPQGIDTIALVGAAEIVVTGP